MNNQQERTSPLAWILLAVVIFLLCGITRPIGTRSRNDGDFRRSVNNARNIGLALLEFQQEYGRFPDASTAEKIWGKSSEAMDFAFSSSDGYFSQLIESGIVADDTIFYAKTAYTVKPGEQLDQNVKSLSGGEVGFGYLMNGVDSLTTEGNPSRAILCSPLAYDGKSVSNRLFDPEINDGKAVTLRLDGSVQVPRIHPKTNDIMQYAGKSLLDTGTDTVWGTDTTPVIVPPLPSR